MKEASARLVSCSSSVLKNRCTKSNSVLDSCQSEDSLDWNIELSETDAHDEEGKLLTSLVRKTYIQHLQKSLLQNYECWCKSYGAGVELSEFFIARCAVQLEKKALRACMLASLYQQSVVTLIKSIKKSTNHKKLFEDLLIPLNSSKNCDKSIQTERTRFFTNAYQQTVSEDNQIPICQYRAPRVQSSVVINTTTNKLGIGDVPNLHNILTTQSVFPALNPQPVPNPFVVPNNISTPKFVLSYLPKNDINFENKCSRLSNLSESSAEVSSSKIYDPEIDLFAEDKSFLESSAKAAGVKRKSNVVNKCHKRKKSGLSTPAHNRTLEERLKKFEEIFGDSCEDVPSDINPPDASLIKGNYSKFFSLVSWKQESISQTCELNRRLLSLPPARLKLIKTYFKHLFGENEPIADITPDEFTHCRKRLANIIVCQLTPYFELGQIGSRDVFKALAREITRIILNETYAADMQFSQVTVDEIFKNGTKYKSLDDLNILCCQ